MRRPFWQWLSFSDLLLVLSRCLGSPVAPHVCPDASQTRSDALRRSASACGCNCVPTAQMCLYGPNSALHGLLGAIPHKCPSKVVQARTGRSGASHRGLAAFPAQSLSRKQKHRPLPFPHGWVKNFRPAPTRPTPFVGVKFPHPLSARPTPSRGVKNLGVDRARPTPS